MAKTNRPASVPASAPRHWRVTPTATTMATISITSIDAARNVETKTLTFMRPHPRPRQPTAIRDAQPYEDLGGDYFLRRETPERLTRHLVRQLERLGQSVTLKPLAEAAR